MKRRSWPYRSGQEGLAVGVEPRDGWPSPGSLSWAYRPMKDGFIARYRVTEAMLRIFIDQSLVSFSLFKPDVMVSVGRGVTSTERSRGHRSRHPR